ncbi:MAG: AI-2E family transporter [Pirellula sp.]|nr:AI-2E family transporter [Pirellula sp.]
MTTTETQPISLTSRADGSQLSARNWTKLLQRLAIWVGFLVLLYIVRDFFFTAFMTFLICYYTLLVVGIGMRRLSPDRERTWLRRLLTIGVFFFVPVLLLGIGVLISPHFAAQGRRLSGWIRYASPETEAARLLEDFVGPVLFNSEFGNQDTPAYQEAFAEYRAKGELHALEYYRFPSLEAWVEGSIFVPIADEERERIRSWLISEGASSQAFAEWFIREKAPELADQAQLEVPKTGRPAKSVSSLVRAAVTSSPAQLLDMLRRDPPELEILRNQWIEDTLTNKFDEAKASPAFVEQLRKAYDDQRQISPQTIAYSFDEYTKLSKARHLGRKAFADALDQLKPPPVSEEPAAKERRLRSDFESATKHDLFQKWWSTNSVAQFIRHKLQAMVDPGVASRRIESILGALLNVPVSLATALTLSIFICIDFVNLKNSMPRLRGTWLRDVYDEVAPALVDMGNLIGRFMQLQGFIALLSAILTSIGLAFIGVEHVFLLGLATFILCLVPTLGSVLAIILIVGMALFQYGGGFRLAVQAGMVASFVSLVDSFVLSPRILGRRMELHPVTLITVLPLAQYFFGIWGLILATPVAVYVVNVIILERGLPGTSEKPTNPRKEREQPSDALGVLE